MEKKQNKGKLQEYLDHPNVSVPNWSVTPFIFVVLHNLFSSFPTLLVNIIPD